MRCRLAAAARGDGPRAPATLDLDALDAGRAGGRRGCERPTLRAGRSQDLGHGLAGGRGRVARGCEGDEAGARARQGCGPSPRFAPRGQSRGRPGDRPQARLLVEAILHHGAEQVEVARAQCLDDQRRASEE
jgi:hypothetical protein